MAFYYIVLVAFIQGITEFLPISSSAHLMLLPKFTNHVDQGLMIDVAAHFGTMLAVCLYFIKDVWKIALGGFDCLRLKIHSQNSKLFLNIVIGTLPVIIAGFIVHQYFVNGMRHIEIIAFGTIVFALFLYWSDKYFISIKKMQHMNLKELF